MSSADERIINRLQRIYDAQGAGGASFESITGEPTDNAALGAALAAKGPAPSDTAYDATTWNGVATIPPSKNAVRDKIDAMDTTIATKQTAAQVATAIAAAGGKLLDTAGVPDNGVGSNGDFAFDDATKTIYGPKAAGVWPAGVVLGGSSAPYSVYTAVITQSGSSAPVATILHNDLSGAIVWTRSDPGEYIGTLNGAFPAGKTPNVLGILTAGFAPGGAPNTFAVTRNTDNAVALTTNTDGNPDDGLLNANLIEIRVYP